MNSLYIDTDADLTTLCAQLNNAPWLALDTEFIREKTYYPRLCLIQVATPDLIACIDPLAINDLSPFLDLLYNPAIIKVFHAARQDLEIFYALRGSVPAPVFDTQVAATVLGQGEQVGYANLVKTLLHVDLDKAHSRTDWSQRPLSEAQIQYAADDVRYLIEVYQQQLAQLEERQRLDWLSEDFAELVATETYSNPPEQAWKRIKGNNRLKGVQLAVLQKLAAWREEQAKAQDRPRRWLFKDDVLVDLARLMPKGKEQLQKIRGLERGHIERHGDTLLKHIAEARALPKEQWPKLTIPPRLQPEQEALVDALMAIVRLRGVQQHVSPATIASRKDLERLLRDDPECNLSHGWREALVGHELQALLAGKLSLRIEQGKLALIPVG